MNILGDVIFIFIQIYFVKECVEELNQISSAKMMPCGLREWGAGGEIEASLCIKWIIFEISDYWIKWILQISKIWNSGTRSHLLEV